MDVNDNSNIETKLRQANPGVSVKFNLPWTGCGQDGMEYFPPGPYWTRVGHVRRNNIIPNSFSPQLPQTPTSAVLGATTFKSSLVNKGICKMKVIGPFTFQKTLLLQASQHNIFSACVFLNFLTRCDHNTNACVSSLCLCCWVIAAIRPVRSIFSLGGTLVVEDSTANSLPSPKKMCTAWT